MGRNAKKTGKGKPGAANKSKKDKNVFKVNDSQLKKKPKEVQGKLKKIKETAKTIKNKHEKADATLKALHTEMMVKKPAAAASKLQAVKKAGKKAPAATKNVSSKLGNLKV